MKLFIILLLLMSGTFYGNELKISQGEFIDKVNITWSVIPNAEYYSVARVYDSPTILKRGKPVIVPVDVILSNTKQTSYTDKTIAFGQHKYIVNAYRTNIEAKSETPKELNAREKLIKQHGTNIAIPIVTNVVIIKSLTNTGYRQVSDQEFFLEFQKAIDSSLPRIRSMKMLNFFGEKREGLRSGKLVYKTTGIFRKPFRVMIDYDDFIDQNLKLNGTYEVQIFKLFAQEGKLVGTFLVDGIYKGTVTHNLIIDGGQSVGGTYDVQQAGKKMVSLPWNVTEHPLDDTQYEEALKNTLKEEKE